MLKKVLVIHGPNLDKLGSREPNIYGSETLNEINQRLKEEGDKVKLELEFFQSNHEGELIDKIGSTDADSIIINPAGLTHTSVALSDSLSAFRGRVIEVHLSNIFAREEFRHRTITTASAEGMICGFGSRSYMLALKALIND